MDYSFHYKIKPDEFQDEPQNHAIDNVATPMNTSTNISRAKLLFYIFLSAAIMIFYVSNVIEVKSLLKTNYELKKKKELVENKNQVLITKINELESPERITKIAKENLGMYKNETTPSVLK